jgi:hypothetical protein
MTSGVHWYTSRTDLIVRIIDEKGCEKLPLAWHTPETSDIVLNARLIKNMELVLDLRDWRSTPRGPAAYQAAIGHHIPDLSEDDDGAVEASPIAAAHRVNGVLIHEAAHAALSHFVLDPWYQALMHSARGRAMASVITTLDEVRIEYQQAQKGDDRRSALRFSSRMLLPSKDELEEIKSEHGIPLRVLAEQAALVLGRHDAKILLDYEVKEYRELMEDILGPELLEAMADIWKRFMVVPNKSCQTQMLKLADQWLKLFETEDGGKDKGEGEGSGEGGEALGEMIGLPGLADMLGKLMDEISEGAEKWAKHRDDERAPDEMADPDKSAAGIFESKKRLEDADKETTHGHTRGVRGNWRVRAPNVEEETAANKLARQLEELSITTKRVTKITSEAPPGRLRTRAALARDAAHAQKRASKERPWARPVHKYTDHPKLTVGIATDVSGSMGAFTEFSASAAWIVAKAIEHVHGSSASVTFGEIAEPVRGPHDKLDVVKVREAVDGSEAFNEAVAALDGVLRLSDPRNGVRLLFVVTDGHLVAPGEMKAAQKWVKQLTANGAGVVWVTPQSSNYRGYPTTPPGVTELLTGRHVSVSTLLDDIGRKIIQALSRGRRRA